MYQEQTITTKKCREIPPAQLLVGSVESTTDYAIRHMQSVLCTQRGCLACNTCAAISRKKYYNLQWISPQERYTLDDIQPIHETIAFSLDNNNQYFFVIAHADRLSTGCANTLLKIVEEPPHGYHFLFLSENKEAVLPTIRSRCVTTIVGSNTAQNSSALLPFFTTTSLDNPAAFLQVVESNKTGDREAMALVSASIEHWTYILKDTSDADQRQHALHALDVLHSAMENGPASGSTKLFLKNIYLHLKKVA